MSTDIETIQPAPGAFRTAYGASGSGSAARRATVRADDRPSPGAVPGPAAAGRLREDAPAESTDVSRAVDDMNSRMAQEKRSIRFRLDEETNRVQIQIVDTERHRIVRSVPSDEMLNLASRMRELSGIGAMVDQSR